MKTPTVFKATPPNSIRNGSRSHVTNCCVAAPYRARIASMGVTVRIRRNR